MRIFLSLSFEESKSSLRSENVLKKKTNFMAPFYGWGSTASRLEPLRGGSLHKFENIKCLQNVYRINTEKKDIF